MIVTTPVTMGSSAVGWDPNRGDPLVARPGLQPPRNSRGRIDVTGLAAMGSCDLMIFDIDSFHFFFEAGKYWDRNWLKWIQLRNDAWLMVDDFGDFHTQQKVGIPFAKPACIKGRHFEFSSCFSWRYRGYRHRDDHGDHFNTSNRMI